MFTATFTTFLAYMAIRVSKVEIGSTYLCLFPSVEITRSDFALTRLSNKTGLNITSFEPRYIRRFNY